MIVTRFAPSPTGFLHIGGARTALFSYLHAKHHGGKFLLRMEDTDEERSKPEFAESIQSSLNWLGIHWDNTHIPYQSKRLTIYQGYRNQLLDKGVAYEKDGAVFLKGNPEVDDFVIFKSSGMPTFHFAVVIDDHEMGVNTIIRGVDHLTNTDKHKLIYSYLGLPVPNYFHIPLIVDENQRPLSKRRNDSSVVYYQENHYLPAAVLNYIARLGWGYGDEEIFSKQDLIQKFKIEKVSKNPARWDPTKLNWLNTHYIRTASRDVLRGYPFAQLKLLLEQADADPNRAELLHELQQKAFDLAELNHLIQPYLKDTLIAAENHQDYEEFKTTYLHDLTNLFQQLEPWTKESLHDGVNDFIEQRKIKMKDIAMPLRMILTGQKKSLDLFSLIYFIGRDTVLNRMTSASS